MINLYNAKKFCKDDISLIENYDKAIADTTKMWHCHHRRETIFSKADLIEIGEYYNRPACELIFLTSLEHNRLHKSGKHRSAEARKKIGEALKGKRLSTETRKKMSEALKGKRLSEEHKLKLSEALKGKRLSTETRKKMSEALKGKRLSEEHKRKLGDVTKGTQWYNNGVICVRAKTCPEGFVKGRIKK